LSDAREQVLAAIRSALGDRPPVDGSAPAAAPAVQPPGDPHTLIALFVERLRDYGATITECESAGVSDAVREACVRQKARRLVIPAGLPAQWRPDGIELIADGADGAHEALTSEQLDALDGVLTGAAVGIAQSGTIALDAGPDQGRRALTLIPDLHVCVVEAGRIVDSLPEALERLAPAVQPGRRAITLISGPSATADIELRRVQGVHGPRRLEVIIPGA
jgi:L-lactate dehydrogenase complex protein LldG